MKKLIVNHRYNGKNLNTFLLENIPNLSSNLLYKTLRKRDIKINGKRTSENVIIYENDEILVYIADALLERTINLDIFFEDENILILNKPYNIEVTGNNSLTTLVHQNYKNSIFKPMPCHRIDRNTTGLVLFAKNEVALAILLDKFKQHEIEKHYLALVYGIPKNDYKRCEAYLFKDTKKSFVYISDSYKKGYQKIVTTYEDGREVNRAVGEIISDRDLVVGELQNYSQTMQNILKRANTDLQNGTVKLLHHRARQMGYAVKEERKGTQVQLVLVRAE